MSNLVIKQKCYDMIQYGYVALKHFPKSEKFGLATDIKDNMYVVLKYIIIADKKYYKKTTIQELDVELAKLKTLVRLSKDLGFLPNKKYEVWSNYLVEIGKMVGGWLKTAK